jgi:hypothetical protein
LHDNRHNEGVLVQKNKTRRRLESGGTGEIEFTDGPHDMNTLSGPEDAQLTVEERDEYRIRPAAQQNKEATPTFLLTFNNKKGQAKNTEAPL